MTLPSTQPPYYSKNEAIILTWQKVKKIMLGHLDPTTQAEKDAFKKKSTSSRACRQQCLNGDFERLWRKRKQQEERACSAATDTAVLTRQGFIIGLAIPKTSKSLPISRTNAAHYYTLKRRSNAASNLSATPYLSGMKTQVAF